MELLGYILEDWTESLDIFGSVWLETLGVSRTVEDWTHSLNLAELLVLDVLCHMDLLLEHHAVCFNILGPLYADDPCLWLLLQS